RVEAALEEMAGHRVAVVEPLGILAVQLLESRREVARRLEHKVVVVWHQAVGVAAPPPASHDDGEELGEAGAIALVLVDRLASVATRGHVVDGAGDDDPRRAGHRPTVRADAGVSERPNEFSTPSFVLCG